MAAIEVRGGSARIVASPGSAGRLEQSDLTNVEIVDCRRVASAPDTVREGESAEYAVFVQNSNTFDQVVTIEFLVEGDVVQEASDVIDADDTQTIRAPVPFTEDVFTRVFFGPGGQEDVSPEVRVQGKTDAPLSNCDEITLVQEDAQQPTDDEFDVGQFQSLAAAAVVFVVLGAIFLS